MFLLMSSSIFSALLQHHGKHSLTQLSICVSLPSTCYNQGLEEKLIHIGGEEGQNISEPRDVSRINGERNPPDFMEQLILVKVQYNRTC